jgi:hypothetical protein
LTWEAVTAIATAASTGIILVTVIVFYFQLIELKKSAVAEAFATIANILDNEKVRNARHALEKNSKENFADWTPQEKDDAETVCTNYDTVGIIVCHKMVDKEMVTREWRTSIIESFDHAWPMIKNYRIEKKCGDYWADFQWLCDEARSSKCPPQ